LCLVCRLVHVGSRGEGMGDLCMVRVGVSANLPPFHAKRFLFSEAVSEKAFERKRGRLGFVYLPH